MLEITSQK